MRQLDRETKGDKETKIERETKSQRDREFINVNRYANLIKCFQLIFELVYNIKV